MNRKLLAVAALASAFTAVAEPFNHNTDWMAGSIGVFMHYWPDAEHPNRTETFDVAALKAQLQEMKVDFFFITLGQNTNWYIAPNDVYEEMAGYRPGERCSRRDIPGEIISSLKGTGIRVCLYSPCAPSFRDTNAEVRLGFHLPSDPKKDRNPFMTDKGIANWAKACQAWAARYGEDVHAWWFDGAYARIGFTKEHARMLSQAVKKANPKMVVSFNIGVVDWDPEVRPQYEAACAKDPMLARRIPFREWRECNAPWTTGRPMENVAYHAEWADFTPGETAQPFRFPIGQRWIDGNQAFILTYVGDYWSKTNVRYPDEVWIPFVRDYLRRGGCLAFDMGKDWETGVFEPAQAAQLGRIVRAVREER